MFYLFSKICSGPQRRRKGFIHLEKMDLETIIFNKRISGKKYSIMIHKRNFKESVGVWSSGMIVASGDELEHQCVLQM